MYPTIRAMAPSTLFLLAMASGVFSSEPQVSVTSNLTSMPMAFTENQGQWDDQVKFRSNAGGATMWFTPGGACYQFTRRVRVVTDVDPLRRDTEPDEVVTMMIGVSFVGANPNARVIGENLTEYKCNYFIGNDRSRWRTDVPNYRAVVYEDIYPGIDLKYYGNGKQMEYDWVVPPFADYSQIRIRYDGSLSMSVSPTGELVVKSKWGTVVEQRPVIYQVVNNMRVPVEGEYVLKGDNCFGFEITDDYDWSLPLVIDPVLMYSTYLGGSGDEMRGAITADSLGFAYVTGYTTSTDFPTQGPYQTNQSDYDVFVTKIDTSGVSLIYSTYLGGSGADYGLDVAVDDLSCAYLTGMTGSSDFPTQDPYQTYQGIKDVFITKLNSSGNGLVYSTLLGSFGDETGGHIAIDSLGCAYITGSTGSTTFPTLNPIQTSQNDWDVFVTKLNSSGNGLVYSTYLGGNRIDHGFAICVDDSGCAYVAGETYSTDFLTVNAYQTYQGLGDAFVAKLNSAGDGLIYSTYLGGVNLDNASGIAIDEAGYAYVTGRTQSTDFPTLNPYQTHQGNADAYVSKLDILGDGLIYSTYLGGSFYDRGRDIIVDDLGCAYVVGITGSSDFPVVNPFQIDQEENDVFVAKLASSGSSLVYCTHLGGSSDEEGWGITIAGSTGDVYVIGETKSIDFPNVLPYQGSLLGPSDAFVARLTADTSDFYIGEDYPVGDYPLSIAAADFDLDDDNDLAVADYESDSISILFNNGDGSFAPTVDYPSGDGPRSICAADVENDGDMDLAVANEFDNNVSVYINNGSGVFSGPFNYACGTGPVAICAGFLNNDAFVDLVVANFSVDSMTILFNDGDGTFDGSTDGVVGYGTGNGPRSVYTADLDKDGDYDVAVANELDDDVTVYLNIGGGSLVSGSDIPVDDAPVSITGSDLDNDGDQDLVTANYESDNVSVIENDLVDGFGGLVDGVVGYGTGNGPRSVFTADLDGDGDDDLIAANELSDDVSVLHNNGDATFVDALPFASHDGPSGVVAADLDGDFDNDVAVVNCESNDVVILINQTDVPICCEVRGDFDHDGSFTPLDAIALVNYLWLEGASPVCYEEVDVNDSGGVDPMDAVYVVNYFWLGGPAPVACP